MAGTDAASTFDDFITLYRSNPVGFVRDVLQQLPMEFAVEATKLLGVKLEGSVG